MGILETVCGHDKAIKALIFALKRGRLPSQLLFVGPEGVGKKKVAWGLAEVLLCQKLITSDINNSSLDESKTAPQKEAPKNVLDASLDRSCGICSSCLKIRSGAHESVLFVEPEKNLIKIERAREIQDFLSLAHDDKARVIIVDDAHCLNPQASNSLLKLLEEPPPKTFFFFITHRWTQLLPTIRSRTTRISFGRLSEQELASWADPHQEENLIRLARGSVKELLSQKEEDASAIREEAFVLFQKFFSDPQFLVLGSWRDQIKDKEKLILFIRYWLISFNEYFSLKIKKLNSESRSEEGNRLSSQFSHLRALENYSDERIWSLWDKGLQLEAGVLGHRDPTLLIEEWLL